MSYRTLTTHITVHDVAEDTITVSTIERTGRNSAFEGLRFVHIVVDASDTDHDRDLSADVHITSSQARAVAIALLAAAEEAGA